ncbi:MAG: nickel pincer cofactor biosynthesis protein LarC, partial [Planctomycetota bacterium]|nr:nickel pincer cofactor biosynthesis protein LarC [Planctomycetota bacterium]
AGAPFGTLRGGLAALDLDRYEVGHERVMRCGIAAEQFLVRHDEDHHHRGLTRVLEILEKLPDDPRGLANGAFLKLGQAEAKIHNVSVDDVHFHEVGAVDALCDIAGAALLVDALGIDAIYCRPLPLTTGSVQAAHGRIPVTAPATLELLRGIPVRDTGENGEWVTPTGAAMMAAWARFEAPPPFTPRSIGYGAGTRDPDGYPNVCRVVIGDTGAAETAHDVFELACDVDDATPQLLGHLVALLLDAGALDATLQPVFMKKQRPGTRVGVLARRETVPALEQILLREGATLGVRRHAVERTELPRETVTVETRYGPVRVKLGRLGNAVVRAAPEYDDCRALALQHGVPLRDVLEEAMLRWRG